MMKRRMLVHSNKQSRVNLLFSNKIRKRFSPLEEKMMKTNKKINQYSKLKKIMTKRKKKRNNKKKCSNSKRKKKKLLLKKSKLKK
jgi:hypothetical protein